MLILLRLIHNILIFFKRISIPFSTFTDVGNFLRYSANTHPGFNALKGILQKHYNISGSKLFVLFYKTHRNNKFVYECIVNERIKLSATFENQLAAKVVLSFIDANSLMMVRSSSRVFLFLPGLSVTFNTYLAELLKTESKYREIGRNVSSLCGAVTKGVRSPESSDSSEPIFFTNITFFNEITFKLYEDAELSDIIKLSKEIGNFKYIHETKLAALTEVLAEINTQINASFNVRLNSETRSYELFLNDSRIKILSLDNISDEFFIRKCTTDFLRVFDPYIVEYKSKWLVVPSDNFTLQENGVLATFTDGSTLITNNIRFWKVAKL